MTNNPTKMLFQKTCNETKNNFKEHSRCVYIRNYNINFKYIKLTLTVLYNVTLLSQYLTSHVHGPINSTCVRECYTA